MGFATRFKKGFAPMIHLTNRSSQPLAAAMFTFDFLNQFFLFSTLAAAGGGSSCSR
jgi:hypothetical protein